MSKYITTLFVSIFLVGGLSGQQIIRSSISSLGNTYHSQSLLLRQTVGQSGLTQSGIDDGLLLRQGFQQPIPMHSRSEGNVPAIPQLALYPNPNAGSFILDWQEENVTPFTYEIFNALGEIVEYDQRFGRGQHQLYCERCLPGIYFVRIGHPDYQHRTIRFLIQP